jgi:hypothetical protein
MFTLLLTAGCDKFIHRKKATIPPHAQVPTLAPQIPDRIPDVAPEPTPVVVAQEEPKAAEPKPPPKTRHRSTGGKKTTPPVTPANPPNNGGGTTTVATNRPPEPPVPDTAIAAVVPTERATQDKQSTSQMLDVAEKTIRGLDDRTLSEDQKAMVSQVWSFITQSKKATTDGDLERALNLAKKAQLLSEALVKK